MPGRSLQSPFALFAPLVKVGAQLKTKHNLGIFADSEGMPNHSLAEIF